MKESNMKNEGQKRADSEGTSSALKKPGHSNSDQGSKESKHGHSQGADHSEGRMKGQQNKPGQDSQNKQLGQYGKKEASCGCGPSCSTKNDDRKDQDQKSDMKQGKSLFSKSQKDREEDENEKDINYSEDDEGRSGNIASTEEEDGSQEEDLASESTENSTDEERHGKKEMSKAKNEESQHASMKKNSNEDKRKHH